jgi:hypothetical protein
MGAPQDLGFTLARSYQEPDGIPLARSRSAPDRETRYLMPKVEAPIDVYEKHAKSRGRAITVVLIVLALIVAGALTFFWFFGDFRPP